MIAAKSAGWPSLPRWPARFHGRAGPAALGAVGVVAALLVLAPLLSLILLAFAVAIPFTQAEPASRPVVRTSPHPLFGKAR